MDAASQKMNDIDELQNFNEGLFVIKYFYFSTVIKLIDGYLQ